MKPFEIIALLDLGLSFALLGMGIYLAVIVKKNEGTQLPDELKKHPPLNL